MIRKAFVMMVEPSAHDEYKRRHDVLWPEMRAVLKSHGAHGYSIYLDRKRSLLFACVELESEERWKAVAGTEACRKWWAYMRDIMPSNPDNSPVSEDLAEVFHLD
jgi:L-rhamnose mutarotase